MSIMGLHRKEGEEREPHDYYATHSSSIPPLLKILGWEKGGKVIRENSCGAGHLSFPLELAGHKVISSDLIDRGYGITGVDFLKDNELDSEKFDATIMNPPYKYALAFVKKALTQSPITCAFLRITFLESERRKKFFDENPPRYVAVFSKRMKSSKSGLFKTGESSTVCYAWFIWETGFKGKPEILWI